jgi:hypothetical protein
VAKYIVESQEWQILYDGQMSDGALGQGGGPDKIYLHVIDVADDAIKRLVPRVDEHGNRESDRLALPNNDEWWIAVSGRKAWPKTFNPKLISTCEIGADGIPRAKPLSEPQLAVLKKLGVALSD